MTSFSQLTDAELAALHTAGNPEAFTALVERYARQLYGYACRLTGSPAEGDDMAQETFVRLHEHIHKLDVSEPLKPWLFKVCTNLCRNYAKRKKAVLFSQLESTDDDGNSSLLDTLESTEPTPDERHQRSATANAVRDAVARLPQKYQVVVSLYYWNELSYEEMADILGLPLNTIRTHLRRAKALLSSDLQSIL